MGVPMITPKDRPVDRHDHPKDDRQEDRPEDPRLDRPEPCPPDRHVDRQFYQLLQWPCLRFRELWSGWASWPGFRFGRTDRDRSEALFLKNGWCYQDLLLRGDCL
jgi:hypothetical protein